MAKHRRDGSLTTSQGFRVLPRVVKFYAELFDPNSVDSRPQKADQAGKDGSGSGSSDSKDPLARAMKRLGYDVLVLDLKTSHEGPLQALIRKHKDKPRGEIIIKCILLHALSRAGSEDRRLQRNALATLYNLLYVILHHSVPRTRPLDALDLVLGRGQGAGFVRALMVHSCTVIKDKDPKGLPATDAALKLLLTLASASINVHQNALLELFYTEKVFNLLMLLLTTEKRATMLPITAKVKIMVILVPVIHFKRFESRNIGLDVLTKRLSAVQLESFNACLASLFRLAQHLFAELPAQSTSSGNSDASGSSSSIATSLRSGFGAILGLMGHLMDSSQPAPLEPKKKSGPAKRSGLKGANAGLPDGVQMSTEWCFRKTRHCLVDLCFFLLHTMVRDNKKYLIRIAKIQRLPKGALSGANDGLKQTTDPKPEPRPPVKSDAKAAPGRPPLHSGPMPPPPPPAVAPTRPAEVIERYLSLCSVILQQPLGARALPSVQLCLAVAHQLSQDTAANVLLFSMRGGPHDHLLHFERNAVPGEIDPDASQYDIKTKQFRAGRWRRKRPTAAAAAAAGGAEEAPLVASLFDTVLGFIRRQLPRVRRMRDEQASTLVVLLDVLYRHLTYHIHATLEPNARRYMAQCYLQLGNALLGLILGLGRLPALAEKPKADTGAQKDSTAPAAPLIQAMYQSAHFLHLILCVRGRVFGGKKREEGGEASAPSDGGEDVEMITRSKLLFELTRNAPELERVCEKLSWAPIVQKELSAVSSAARALGELVDKGTRTPTKGALPQSAEEGNTPRHHGMTPSEVRGLVSRVSGRLHVVPLLPSRQVRETAVFDTKTDQRFFNQVVNSLVQDFASLWLCGDEMASAVMEEEESHWAAADPQPDPPKEAVAPTGASEQQASNPEKKSLKKEAEGKQPVVG